MELDVSVLPKTKAEWIHTKFERDMRDPFRSFMQEATRSSVEEFAVGVESNGILI